MFKSSWHQERLENRQGGKEVCAVFFGNQKAFHAVPHLPLVKKLKKMSFHSCIVEWVTDFLTHCLQYVVVNGHSSGILPAGSSVPQGSGLEPLLFLIYNISKVDLHQDSTFHTYADDIRLYHTIHSPAGHVNLQQSIESRMHWSDETSLTLNHSKC